MSDRRNEREGGIGGRNKRGEEKDRGRRGGKVDGGGGGREVIRGEYMEQNTHVNQYLQHPQFDTINLNHSTNNII